MSYAQLRSEDSASKMWIPHTVVESATVFRFPQGVLRCLIWPTQTRSAATSPNTRTLLARIEELQRRLAVFEHRQMVEDGTIASEDVLAAGWDNPLDAEYDKL